MTLAVERIKYEFSFRLLGCNVGKGNVLKRRDELRQKAALGETRKAIEYYEQALAIVREIGDRRGEGANHGNLGLAYATLGETRKAIKYHEQALKIFREIENKRGEGTALWNMSLALDKLGQRAKAIDCAKAALKIREEIEDPHAEKIRRKLQEWENKSICD